MEIENIVLHHVIKELKGKPVLKCSKKLLKKDETVNEFVKTLIKNYSSKNPTQGTFEVDATNFPFQTKCKTYFEDKDFLKFTTEAMDILKKEIDIATTTGGYVVFVHYIEKKIDYIITAMLDKSTQFTVDDDKEDLGIEKLMALDIEKLARANRINIDKWIKNDTLYLSFIKGTREVSKYFVQFIGSTDITSSKENFRKLKDSVDIYIREKKLSKSRKDKIRESISVYIGKCYTEKNDVDLDSISSLIDNENPKSFTDFLLEKEIEVSDKISIYKKSDYETFTRNKVKEDGYTLTFEKALIKNKKITKQGNSIIIHNVAADILTLVFEE